MTIVFDFSYRNWSTGLIHEELRYKVRRHLVHQLDACGIWQGKERFSAIRRERKALGTILQRKLLEPALGQIDYSYLSSEFAFGLSNYYLHSRLPIIMSLGYDVGRGIYSQLIRGKAAHHNVGALCALFNFGVAAYDRICDDLIEDAQELYRSFDEGTLRHLTNDPLFCTDLAEVAEDLHSPEIRIVLKVICSFFAHLHDWALVPRDSDVWKALDILLIESYRSQMGTVQSHLANDSITERVNGTSKKSILPFMTMLQICRVCEGYADISEVPAVDDLVNRIGLVFSLLDDLIDVARDIELGNINTVLLRAGGSWSFQQWSNSDDLGRHLLEGKIIEDSIDSLCTNLAEVVQLLENTEFYSIDKPRLQDSVVTYVQNWIGG